MSTYDNTDIFIVKTLDGHRRTFGKKYCYPTQKKILEKIKEYHCKTISRRTLNRHLRKLEDNEVIKRTKRHYKDTHGSLICRSTLYYWGKKFNDFLSYCKFLGNKLLNLLGVPYVAQNYKKSTDLLFKISGDRGKIVNNLWKTRFSKAKPSL